MCATMRRWLAASTLVVAVVLSGCDGGGEGRSARRTPAASDPVAGDVAPGPDSGDRAADCRLVQRRELRRWYTPLSSTVDSVLTSTTGHVLARAWLRRHATSQADRAKQVCGAVHQPMAHWVRTVRGLPGGPIGHDLLRQVLRAHRVWGSSVGLGNLSQDALDELAICRAGQRTVDASYRVSWAWTDTGKEWWIAYTVINRASFHRTLGAAGEVRLTGQQGGPSAGAGLVSWGSASYDLRPLPPGTTVLTSRQLGVSLRTAASGTLDVRTIEVWVSPTARRIPGCGIPVRRSS